MEKYVPTKKLSKKAKKQLARQKRLQWNISPVTRKPQNPKAYDRKKSREGDDEFPDRDFFNDFDSVAATYSASSFPTPDRANFLFSANRRSAAI